MRPAAGEYAPFYASYVDLVPEDDVLAVLAAQRDEVLRVAASVPSDRETHRYADGKWTVRGMFGHIGDGERVFGYRAFCIGRGDQAAFPGFDQDDYMAAEDYSTVPLAELSADFARLRDSNLSVLRRLPPGRWAQVGTASNAKVTVRALAYVMAGHVRHHLAVLKERYGVTA
jgi:DinB superfamily